MSSKFAYRSEKFNNNPNHDAKMTIKEDQQLSNSEYWDSRYVNSNGDDPTHEWFRSFEHLQPFLGKNLLEQPGRTAQDNPKVLHLGSGDSVRGLEYVRSA